MQSLLMLSGLGVLCWVVLRNRTRRKRRSEPAVITDNLGHNANASRSRDTFSGTQSLSAPTEVLKWQVELHDLGRELKGELDSKMIAVRALTQQYDQSAKKLSALIQMADQLKLPMATLQSIATRLRTEGWDDEKIAVTLGVDVEEAQRLAASGSPLPSGHSHLESLSADVQPGATS